MTLFIAVLVQYVLYECQRIAVQAAKRLWTFQSRHQKSLTPAPVPGKAPLSTRRGPDVGRQRSQVTCVARHLPFFMWGGRRKLLYARHKTYGAEDFRLKVADLCVAIAVLVEVLFTTLAFLASDVEDTMPDATFCYGVEPRSLSPWT